MVLPHLALPPAGPSFYANVFHHAFNLDAEEAKEAVEVRHTHQGCREKRAGITKHIWPHSRGEARGGKLVILSLKSCIIDTFRPNRNVQG
jgi:hypothetical protein